MKVKSNVRAGVSCDTGLIIWPGCNGGLIPTK